MNAMSISCWGMFLYPDNRHAVNIWFRQDYSISKFEDGEVMGLHAGFGNGYVGLTERTACGFVWTNFIECIMRR